MDLVMGYSTSHSAVTTTPLRPTSNEDWDAHRETFHRLYYDEDRTLNEVMDTLKRDYGFRATYIYLSPIFIYLMYVKSE